MRLFLHLCAPVAIEWACSAALAAAHEFWLSPVDYTLAPGAEMAVHGRVGEGFRGATQVYNPGAVARFEVIAGGTAQPVEMRFGDDPMLSRPAPGPGLAIVVHETTDRRLTYRDAEVFRRFVVHKDLAGVLDRHAARGLPEAGFDEFYRRHAKALVAVGDGAGADRRLGLRIEIVAEANPYTDDLSAGLPVRVWYDGRPRAGAQVELFARAPDGAVTVTRHRTDGAGRATLPMAAGTEYLVDSVAMEALDGPVPWRSHWAALTFRTP
jgi:hypothetical protein